MRPSWLGQLDVQVIMGILIGGLLGFLWPAFAVTLQPFADGFIKLIKMLLAPIIFATVVLGIAKMGNIKEVGRIGVRAPGFLEEEDVRVCALHPPGELVETRFQRIHVPGGDSHAYAFRAPFPLRSFVRSAAR